MNLKLSLSEARKNEEIISLADSTILRFIDELNGIDVENIENHIKEKRKSLKKLKKDVNNISNKLQIKEIYNELDDLQFKKDYVSVIMDNKSDFDRLNKGFKINGIKYKRLLGTTNGVKKSTIVYVNSNICKELKKRLNNGRNLKKELVPAKFEAYQSLSCSASIPILNTKKILVVDDLIRHFPAQIIKLNDEQDGEPIMEQCEETVELNCSDGFGLAIPELMKIWSENLQEDYLASGICIRQSFCKGMIFPFPIKEFIEKFVSEDNYYIDDVWGDARCIDDIDLILTTSMLKLWDSYESLEDYLFNCDENKYTFSATKICPNELETERNLNYQFLQSYDLDHKEISELVSPTISEIKDVLGNDINKTILFLRGMFVDDNNVKYLEADFIKALMIDKRMINDPYVISKINNMVSKRINQAKIGVLKTSGNYAIVSGDPFALCQHVFKINVNENDIGLLQSGEIYSKHWVDKNVDKVACFRAPMTCHNNIRVMNINSSETCKHWYRYMNTVNIINCKDTLSMAENGMDMDGDQLFTTDNHILINNTKNLPAIVCVQRKAEKKVITEQRLVNSNKKSFGDGIGKTTNRITSMFDVLSQFPINSNEYNVLMYRIMCGQLFQQNAIDKTKGIVAKPMPKTWFDKKAIYKAFENDKEKINFYMSIIADKKPYFMNYIYSSQKAKYNKYIQNANKKCLMEYNISLNDLLNRDRQGFSSTEQKKFIEWYYKKMPVGINNCTMNKICRYVEKEFDGYVSNIISQCDFDYNILKSGVDYSRNNFTQIEKIYQNYLNLQKEYYVSIRNQNIDKDDKNIKYQEFKNQFKRDCYEICSNEKELCDILLDICYNSNKSKQFVWDICGNVIIENLLDKNGGRITYLVQDENGKIEYCGKKFKQEMKYIDDVED